MVVVTEKYESEHRAESDLKPCKQFQTFMKPKQTTKGNAFHFPPKHSCTGEVRAFWSTFISLETPKV